MSAVVNVMPKKKTGRGRKPLLPSVKDFCRLCGCSFKVQYGESARNISTENLFQASRKKGITGVVLARSCEDVGLIVTVSSSKSDRVCQACAQKIRNMHQLYSFVAAALQKDEGEEIDRFKRCLPTSISSPERSPAQRKIRKSIEETSGQKRDGDRDDAGEIDSPKCQKPSSRKSLFNPDENQESMNVVAASSRGEGNGDWGLGLLNVDDIVEQNKTKVKVLILYPSGSILVRTPAETSTISVIKNIALKEWKAVANGIFNHPNLAEELPAALKRKVASEFREYCRSDSVLKGKEPEQLAAFSNRLVL